MIKRELKRKSIHISFGILILLLINFAGTEISLHIIGLSLIAGTIISLGITRGHNFDIFKNIVEGVERENEKHFPGKAAIFFFISAIVLLIFFKNSPTIVLAALSVQVFADSMAAIIGTKYGKHKLLGKKSWEGTLTCLIVSIICINFFFPLSTAIIVGIIATIVELLPFDDNLWVPLATGAAIRLLL
ncbi:MAG: phosphatidate cytidylyltransferase [archaeon]|jgi:dolichol kinase